MSKRQTTLHARVSAAILEAAAAVLAERGEQASMADVAAAAGMARATVYRYFPNREALFEALGRLAVEEAGERLQAGRLEEVAVPEAFERAVRALVAVGDYFVVVSRESARPDPAEFERRVASPLRGLIERAQSLGEVRDDLPASWLMESLIGIVVSGLQTRPSLGVEDTVAGITSLFLDGARLQAEMTREFRSDSWVERGRSLAREEEGTMERTGQPAAGVAGQPSEVESKLLRGLVDYLRQKRPELRQEWASRITDAQLLRVMRADEIFSEVTAVYDNYVNALETGSVEALRAYARDLSERIVPRGVETDEVLGTVLLLRDVLARALFVRHQGDPELLGRVLDVYEPAANRIAVIVGVSFVEERERVIREQQAAIRERAEMLHRLSTFLADASLALDAPGSLEEILQLVAEHARELVAAERCRAEIRLPDGTTIDAHAEAEPGTEPVSVPPADVAALYAAVAPGRRSLRMSSAELAAEPARRTLEGAGRPGALDAQLARGVALRSRRQGGRADPGVRQARRRIHPPRRGGARATRPDGGGGSGASAALRARAAFVAASAIDPLQ